MELRKTLGYKYVEDSASKYVNLFFLEKVPEELSLEDLSLSDSLFDEFLALQDVWLEEDSIWEFSQKEELIEDEESIDMVTMVLSEQKSWITRPLFSKDRTLMIVEYGDVCGMLCGYGITILFEFKNGKWSKKEVLAEWVS